MAHAGVRLETQARRATTRLEFAQCPMITVSDPL
jgi:hypothetical protein